MGIDVGFSWLSECQSMTLRNTSECFGSHNYIQSEILALSKSMIYIEIPGAGEYSQVCERELSFSCTLITRINRMYW